MSATVTTPPRSKQEILNDPTLNAFQRSQIFEQMDKELAGNPPPPPPRSISDAGQRAQLENLKHSFSTEEKSLVEIEADRKLFAEILKTTSPENARPDAPREDVINAMISEWRVQKMRIFISNAIPRRQEIERRLMALFHQFNGIASKVGALEQYLSGTCPEKCCADAIAEIERLLKL